MRCWRFLIKYTFMHYLESNKPDHVLAKGEHQGFNWLVGHNNLGHRVGYVAVPVGHHWHGKGYDDIGANVHGGLTYADKGSDGEWWVGFDCAHAGDAADPSLLKPGQYRMTAFKGDVIRDQAFVEAECLSLCEQAAAAA